MNLLPAIQPMTSQAILLGASYQFNDFLMGDRIFHFKSGDQVIGRFQFSEREEHEAKRKFLDALWCRLFFLKNIPDLRCDLTFVLETPYKAMSVEQIRSRMLSKAFNTLQKNIAIIEKSGSLFMKEEKEKETNQYQLTVSKINNRYAS